MNSGAVSDGLVRINGLVELTTAEVLGHQRLDLGNTSGTADENDIIDLLAGDPSVLENALDGVNGGLEQGCVDFLEPGSTDVCGEVLALGDSRALAKDGTNVERHQGTW